MVSVTHHLKSNFVVARPLRSHGGDKLKIVVLDGYTLNPGDLSWSALESIGELTIYDRTPPAEVMPRTAGADIIFTNKTVITKEHIDALPDVKYIGLLATGYNTVDVKAAGERGVIVTNVPAYSTPSVAQLTIALLLELCNHVDATSNAVRAGDWSAAVDFTFYKHPQIELAGKTMGIIGYGQIGRAVGKIAEALGMTVISCDKGGDLDNIFLNADIVSLHCPLFPETEGLVNKHTLAKMKPTAFLLNTSRGGLVVDQELADALNSGKIAGAGLDVLSAEPPPADNPLLSAKNCVITPHIAWASRAARSRLMSEIVKNLQHFLNNDPINVVSPINT